LRSGRPNSIFRSRRPGRSSAGSRVSGRLVAISTLMFPRASNPSSWFTISSIVRCTSLSPPAPSSNRAPPIASTSSKKTMQAFFDLAICILEIGCVASWPLCGTPKAGERHHRHESQCSRQYHLHVHIIWSPTHPGRLQQAVTCTCEITMMHMAKRSTKHFITAVHTKR
jgi:hypothetical protein